VLEKPRECSKCHANFCQQCITDARVNHEYNKCPRCEDHDYEVIDVHPFVLRKLSELKVSCENKEKGCNEKILYEKVNEHRFECPFAQLRCSNYGCSEEFLRQDSVGHEKKCDFKVAKCEKCDTTLAKKEEAHDCIVSLKNRLERMELEMVSLSKKVEYRSE